MEQLPSPLKYIPMFNIVGSRLSSWTINSRLVIFFEKYKHLWDDYAAQAVPFREQHLLTAEELSVILSNLSLRPPVFLEYDDEMFELEMHNSEKIFEQRSKYTVVK